MKESSIHNEIISGLLEGIFNSEIKTILINETNRGNFILIYFPRIGSYEIITIHKSEIDPFLKSESIEIIVEKIIKNLKTYGSKIIERIRR